MLIDVEREKHHPNVRPPLHRKSRLAPRTSKSAKTAASRAASRAAEEDFADVLDESAPAVLARSKSHWDGQDRQAFGGRVGCIKANRSFGVLNVLFG